MGKNLFLLFFWAFVIVSANAQTSIVSNTATTTISLGVSEVSLLKVNDAGAINITLKQRDAGMSIETSNSDSTARLLISSVISNSPRTLTAKISAGNVPVGSNLELTTLQPNSNFVGNIGTFAAPILLDATERIFVTDISTCYSGTGMTDGYPLKFTYGIDINASTYGSLRATSGSQIIVMFTLTAAQ